MMHMLNRKSAVVEESKEAFHTFKGDLYFKFSCKLNDREFEFY